MPWFRTLKLAPSRITPVYNFAHNRAPRTETTTRCATTTDMSLSAGRRPLCAACARATRVDVERRPPAARQASSLAPMSAVTGAPRRSSSWSSCTPRSSRAASRVVSRAVPTGLAPTRAARRPLSQSTRPAAPDMQSQAATPAADDVAASDKNADSATATSLPFYALFPKTLPLGPPPAGPFHIDVRALRSEFLRLQAAAHPDFHHHAGDAVDDWGGASGADGADGADDALAQRPRHSAARVRAEALSSHINEAYRTLASPLLRAQYLLKHRHGMDLAGDESTLGGGGGGGGPRQDMGLLMAVLEVREEIDRAASEDDLEPLRAANNERMRASEAALEVAFAHDDAAAARRAAVRLRYWVNIDDALRNWEKGRDIVLEH